MVGRLRGGGRRVSVHFQLLGEVHARVAGRMIDLGHARQQNVLAVLLVEANHTLSTDELIDRVWGERAPQRARETLYSYLSRLRHALADADRVPLVTERPG